MPAVLPPHLTGVYWYGFDWESFTVHDHYIWNSARPRTEQRTVEMRPACQQPWEEHMVVAALSLGLVEASQEIMQVCDVGLPRLVSLGGWPPGNCTSDSQSLTPLFPCLCAGL